ncbi:MAG TPA: hypothetical protein VG986_02565 [Pseudolabrys sp.]|nr:hypothetical protein [Pseudolabrys sp.]
MVCVIVFVLSLALCATRAQAQDRPAPDGATAYGLSAPVAPSVASSLTPGQDFRLILTLPFLATSNAAGPQSERTGASGSPDVHANPDLLLRWTHQFDFVRLSVAGDIEFDRYAINADQSSNSLTGGVKAAFTDGRSDLFVPYLSYWTVADYEPGFTVRDDLMQNFVVGFTSAVGFSANGGIIPFRNSSGAGDWSLAFDLSAGRRLADPVDFNATFATFTTDLVYNFTPDVHFGLLSKLRFRDYDSYYGQSRRDTFAALQARIELTPDWLTTRLPGAELDLAVEYQRNMSNLAFARYTRWEVGPTLTLTRRF